MVSAIFFKFFQYLTAIVAVKAPWSLSELLLGPQETSSQTDGD